MADETIKITIDDDSLSSTQSDTVNTVPDSIQDVMDELNGLSSKATDAKDSLDDLSSSTDKTKENLSDDLSGDVDRTIESFGDLLSAQVDTITGSLSELEKTSQSFDEQLKTTVQSEQELNEEIVSLVDKLKQVESEFSNLQEKVADQNKAGKKSEKSGRLLIRQTSNLARSSGIVSSSLNQVVNASTALATKLGKLGFVFVAMTVAAVLAAKAMKALDSFADSLAKQIGGFSAESVEANVNKSIKELEDRIRLGQERGQDAAELTNATTEMGQEIRQFKRSMLELFLPLMALIVKLLAGAVKVLNFILEPVIMINNTFLSVKDLFVSLITFMFPMLTELVRQIVSNTEKDEVPPDHSEDFAALFDPDNVGFRNKDRGKSFKKKFDQMFGAPRN